MEPTAAMTRRRALLGLAALALPLPGSAAEEDSYGAPRPDGGVSERARKLLRAQATESLPEKIAWAERIKLGDPHKYIQPIICAKLSLDPADREALDAYRWIKTIDIQKIEGPKDRGLYHFSAIYKARLFFQFGDRLPPDIRDWFFENEAKHLGIFRKGGTENHGMMSRTSGYLFAERFQQGGSGDPATDHKAYFTRFLRDECRKLYRIGMGEWDSSTYVVFSVTGWLNVFDFARDPEIKRIALAALDWYSAAYALKWFHGVHAGPEARGFAVEPADANSDVLAWLWFGGPEPADLSPKNGAVRYSIGAALSGYRPHPLVTKLARKEVPAPFAVRASKPAYYGYEQGNEYQEYLYCAGPYFMGTLYDPTPGNRTDGVIWPQTTQFKLAVREPTGAAVVFGMGNPYHRHFPVEGRSPFDQFHQGRGAALGVCIVPQSASPDPRTAICSLLAVPATLPEPDATESGWLIWTVGETYVAACPLGSGHLARPDDLSDWAKRTGAKAEGPLQTHRFWRTDGALCGWIIDTATRAQYPNVAALRAALQVPGRVDLNFFTRQERTVTYKSLAGDVLTLKHTGGPGGKPEASSNGEPLVFADWPVYDSPCLSQPLKAGRLTVGDGADALTIDHSGERPVWRRTKAKK